MTASTKTRIWTPVDYEADGKQSDCLRLPHSSDRSAYGWIPIPLVCIRNGDGPTALLIAGNHGDEYEGQVALLNLARAVESGDVRGRIIILPALNFPAVLAGRRVSPLDDGNLNRMFPGDPFGSPTEMIAHYVSEVLLPKADLVVDLHSGGRSLQYLGCSMVQPGRTAKEHRALSDLMRLFGAPVSFVNDGAGGGGATTLAAAAHERQVPALTTELGGGGTLCEQGLKLAEDGVRRLLAHLGITPTLRVEPPPPTRLLKGNGYGSFIYAHCQGLFEPAAAIGDEVAAGQLAGRIHRPDDPLLPPETIVFGSPGVVVCRRFPSLTERGDCLFEVMADESRSESPGYA